MTKRNAAPDDLFDEPMTVGLVGQAVVITGPDGMALAVTADAAAASARILNVAAKRARKASPEAFVQQVRLPNPRKSRPD